MLYIRVRGGWRSKLRMRGADYHQIWSQYAGSRYVYKVLCGSKKNIFILVSAYHAVIVYIHAHAYTYITRSVHIIRTYTSHVLHAEINSATRAHHSSPFFFSPRFFFHPLVKKSVSEYITRALTHPRTPFTHIYVVCRPRERGWAGNCRDFVAARPPTAEAAAAVGGIENRNNCASWRVAVGRRVRGIFTNRKRA